MRVLAKRKAIVEGCLYEFVVSVDVKQKFTNLKAVLTSPVPLNMYLITVTKYERGVYDQGVLFGWLCSVLLFVYCLFCTYAQIWRFLGNEKKLTYTFYLKEV